MNTPAPIASERSGLYQAPRELAPLRASAAQGHAAWLSVELAHVRTKEALLNALAEALSVPATFGRNWDALADVLQDLSWRPAKGYVLHLRNAGPAAGALGDEWRTFLEVLAGSTMYWKALGKPFIVFVDSARTLPQWT